MPYQGTLHGLFKTVKANKLFLFHFSYCSLVWMPISHIKNNKMTLFMKRVCAYMQRKAIFISQNAGRDGSVLIHERNLRVLAIEMFNIMKDTASTLD